MTIPPPYLNNDETSFAHTSARERWPKIITSAIDDVHRTVMELSHNNTAKVEEGKSLISSITALKHAILKDRTIEPLPEVSGPGSADIKLYNDELARLGPFTWLTAPWLYSECFLYRLLQTFFERTEHWKDYDVFSRQKTDTFKNSAYGVGELAIRYQKLASELQKHTSSSSKELVKALFKEFVDISLWGNATDLSLLTSITLEDIQSLQGEEARKKNENNILVNDFEQVWTAVSSTPGGTIDIVLDNSGFELYTDLAFALFLLDAKLCDTIVLHPKMIPWFVSDVLPKDFDYLVAQLQQKDFFPDDHREGLDYIASKILDYHSENKIQLKHSLFWTNYCPFWEINANGANGGAEVHEMLKDSKLVIYKGDLNHRKLLGDVAWPKDTPFSTAIGPLASAGIKFVTLRTIKADVVAGLGPNEEQELQKKWIELGNESKYGWAWSGKYALIQYSDGAL